MTARVFSVMHPARTADDERDAVKDDAKLLGQCMVGGITHFATDDARKQGLIAGLPHPISLHEPFLEGWFSNDNQGDFFKGS
jgi:hypothetical protein